MDRCYLCKSKERDEIKFGEFLTRGPISVHYFCLLLTSNLMQKGKDDQGFHGFLLADIKEEANRIAPAVCCYCKKKSANICCCARKCRRTFHLTCGLQNDCENQFIGTFKSYCSRHVTGKKVRGPTPEDTCCICYDNILGENQKFNCVTMIRSPCCKNGWFHKWCIAAFAKSAGYFFKCPLCNDNKVFRQRLVYKGIFIPDRDAAWELEPNAFEDLLERPEECAAVVCTARGGRSSTTNSNGLVFCGSCGSVAIHSKCMTVPNCEFFCDGCSSVLASLNSKSVNISASQQTDTDDEEIDVCGIDDEPLNLITCQDQDYSEDEGTVQPLGKLKKGGHRIFDDEESLPNAIVNSDDGDDFASRTKLRKRNKRLSSSSGSEESLIVYPCAKRNRVISDDNESLFDSGAESARSECSEDLPKDPLELLPSDFIRTEAQSNKNSAKLIPEETIGCKHFNFANHNVAAKSYEIDSLHLSIDAYANSGPITSKQIAQSTLKVQPNTSYPHQKTAIDEISTDVGKRDSQPQLKPCLEAKSYNCKSDKFRITSAPLETPLNNNSNKDSFIAFRTRRRSLCLEQTPVRPRTNSENSSESTPALVRGRPRRQSFLRSPFAMNHSDHIPSRRASRTGSPCSANLCSLNAYITPSFIREKEQDNRIGEACQPAESMSNEKRNYFNSIVASVENENMPGFNTLPKRGSSRSRSPLSANLCSVNAYLTPSFIRKTDQDSRSGAEACPLAEPVVTEKGTYFNTNKSNIPQIKNVEPSKATTSPENLAFNGTKHLVAFNNNGQEIFLQSYKLTVSTQVNPKPFKPKKKRCMSQNLPSSQTKIESFFKRI